MGVGLLRTATTMKSCGLVRASLGSIAECREPTLVAQPLSENSTRIRSLQFTDPPPPPPPGPDEHDARVGAQIVDEGRKLWRVGGVRYCQGPDAPGIWTGEDSWLYQFEQ